MTVNDLSDMQRYLVEEEAEKWQDGAITRRELLRRVTLIVGGAVVATSVLVSLGCDLNAPTPTPGGTPASPAQATAAAGQVPFQVPEDNPLIRAQMVEIPNNAPELVLKGYLAMNQASAGPAKPGAVLVCHENRGLTPYIKDVTRRVAMAGYAALCVDLVSRAGGSDKHPDEADRVGILGQVPTEFFLDDLSAGLDFLKARDDVDGTRLGAIGFCFGGGMVWRLATKRLDLKAAVPFYGPNPPLKDVPNIKAAVLGIYGGKDQRITGAAGELETALKQAGIRYQFKVYPDADHAFHNDTGDRFNRDAARDAWELTLEWLATYVKSAA